MASIQDAVCAAACDAVNTLRDTVPIGFAGLAAKAKATRYIKKDIEEQVDELCCSLIYDLGVIAGEIGPDERPEIE